MSIAIPAIDPGLEALEAGDPAGFIRRAFEGVDLAPLIQARLDALGAGRGEAPELLELGLLFQLAGEREKALLCQTAALAACRLYRHPAPGAPALRLLALVTAGDLMTNTPFELMVEGRPVAVSKLYLDADQPWPETVPDHDLAIMAVSESDEAAPLLEQLKAIEGRWPRPIVNAASKVLALGRDRLPALLKGAAEVTMPPTARVPRAGLEAVADGGEIAAVLEDGGLPIIIRPVGSHAGKALERIEHRAGLAAYLAQAPDAVFYVSRFIDYASADGLFRKYRIALFGGRPFLCHMAISGHWMVHYLNAGMAESAEKRAEEAEAMAGFDHGFALRHAAGLKSLTERIGLDYFAIDCAEARDGSLLIFEADVAMIVHDLDPAELYPYKKPQMRKVFDAFEAFLTAAAAAPR